MVWVVSLHDDGAEYFGGAALSAVDADTRQQLTQPQRHLVVRSDQLPTQRHHMDLEGTEEWQLHLLAASIVHSPL